MAGQNRLKMRLVLAREAIGDLQRETEPARRIELMHLIERLTQGKYGKPGPKNKTRDSAFN